MAGRWETFFDNETVQPDSSATSQSLDTTNNTIMALQITGEDNNGKYVKLAVQVKPRGGTDDAWSLLSQDTFNLTDFENNSKTELYDIGNLEDVRIKLVNNSSNPADITVQANRD